MLIRTKLTRKEFIKINFILLFKKLYIKIIIGFAIVSLGLNALSQVLFAREKFDGTSFFYPSLVVVFVILFTWLAASKSYTSNKRLGETMEYTFDKDYLIVKGESFSAQSSWDKIYKVTQTKDWLLIWHSKTTANFIARNDIWEGDIIQLKEIIDNHKVKNTL